MLEKAYLGKSLHQPAARAHMVVASIEKIFAAKESRRKLLKDHRFDQSWEGHEFTRAAKAPLITAALHWLWLAFDRRDSARREKSGLTDCAPAHPVQSAEAWRTPLPLRL